MALVPQLDYFTYGVGVFALDGSARGDGVLRSTPEEIQGAAGQIVDLRLSQVTSLEQLEQRVTAGVNVNVEAGIYGGSADFDFVKNSNFTNYSVYLLLSSLVTNSFRQMRDVGLTPEARELLAIGHTERFADRYGNAYIHGLKTGGKLCVLFVFTAQSEEESRDISTTVSAHAGVGKVGFSFRTEFGHSLRQLSENSSLDIVYYQAGGDTAAAQTQDEIIAKAIDFAPSVSGDRAVPFMADLRDYKTTNNYPQGPNPLDLQLATDVIRRAHLRRKVLWTALNDTDAVLDAPHRFEKPNLSQLQKQRQDILEAIEQYAAAASRAANNPLDASFSDVREPAITLPKLIGRRKPGQRPRQMPHQLAKRLEQEQARRRALAALNSESAEQGALPGHSRIERLPAP